MTEKGLQEGLVDTGVVVHCSTVQLDVQMWSEWKSDQMETIPHHKSKHLNCTEQHLDTPE